uniref:CB1 cannabinoid receptor-interacting protein 1 n=1 Tax=Nippostrongylus brasiliensis TaxID=27835 RepID=A0A0N4XCK5_NIPBR
LVRNSGGLRGNLSVTYFLNSFFSRVANGDAVSYKVDGERFEGGSRTLKFATNTRYKITLTSKPPAEFHHMHLAGSDLQLHTDDPKSGEYATEWNTTGIDVCKKGERNNIGLTLQGPGGLLKRHLQSKFYQKDDSHADWGHKLESIEWTCAVDDAGNISVTEEQIK